MSKTWKAVETAIAKLINGRRVPITGRVRGDVPDIEHHYLSVEVKHRQAIPEWIKEAMGQAEASAREGKLPIVILHEKNMPYGQSLAFFRLDQIIKLLDTLEER